MGRGFFTYILVLVLGMGMASAMALHWRTISRIAIEDEVIIEQASAANVEKDLFHSMKGSVGQCEEVLAGWIAKQGIRKWSGVVDPTTLEVEEWGEQGKIKTKTLLELTGSPENCTGFDYIVGRTRGRYVLPGGTEL